MREAARRSVRVLSAWLVLAACDAGPQNPARPDAPAPTPAETTRAGAGDVAGSLARATERERSGDPEGALVEAESALRAAQATGAPDRDAALTVAKLAITLGRHDRAAQVLEPLVQRDATDAVAQYDLALVHHRKGDYNRARSGYLAALRADAAHADARFNLAMLCWRRGVQAEAHHHADTFRTQFPDDPRGSELAAMMAGGDAPRPGG